MDSQTDLYSSLIKYLKSMLSGRVLDWRPRGRGFEPHWCHCVVSLSKNINPSLVLVQPRMNRPYITERLLMERIVSNQSNKQKSKVHGHKTRMCHPHLHVKQKSKYDQVTPQSQTADQPTGRQERDTKLRLPQHKVKQPALSSSAS